MFSNLKGLAIPEGNVVKIESNGVVLWKMNVPSTFPTDWELIETYTIDDSISLFPSQDGSAVFIPPEDGWYKFEVYGASGTGGAGNTIRERDDDDGKYYYWGAAGGGGGGGGCAIYCCELTSDSMVAIKCGAVGSPTSASLYIEDWGSADVEVTVTSGTNGEDGNPSSSKGGAGGTGGIAEGGQENYNGSNGSTGKVFNGGSNGSTASGGAGGAAGYDGGNVGGTGGRAYYTGDESGTAGKSGFVKVYRGYVVDLATKLIDFEYTDNGDGTVTLTAWKETLNGVPSTELVIPDDSRIIL